MALFSSLKSRILGVTPTFDPALQEQMQRKGLFDIEGKPITDPVQIRKVLETRKELGMEEETVLRPGPTRALAALPEKEPVRFTGFTPEGKPEEPERISEPAQRRLAIEEQVEKARRFEETRKATPLEQTTAILKGAGLVVSEIGKELFIEAPKRRAEFLERQPELLQKKREGTITPEEEEFLERETLALGLDITPGGLIAGTTKKVTSKITRSLTTKFLDYAKDKTTLSRQEITDFARRPELKKGEADLLNKLGSELKDAKVSASEFADSIRRDLLPLKPVKVKEPQFFTTTIEPRTTGTVWEGQTKTRNYEEVVFESPIATNGSSHYPNSKNYFAHARGDEVIESGKKIWREQEIQSDLLQKEGMAEARGAWKVVPAKFDEEIAFRASKGEDTSALMAQRKAIVEARQKEVSKLEPFTNDRFGERIMRERIKEKASKGYEKYRLPTGETIGKIEGFEGAMPWKDITDEAHIAFGDLPDLTPATLKVGKPVEMMNQPGKWIITDILGDGRFKAVPKSMHESISKTWKKGTEGYNNQMQLHSEIHDLTGKSNPQYRRYSDWGKFLKNKFGGKEVTDPQGNTWMEIDIIAKMKTAPVEAFGILGGVEMDEEGQIGFDPKKAALGIAGIAAIKRIPTRNIKQVFRPEKFDLTPEETTRLTEQFKEAGLEMRTVKPTEQMIEEARNLLPHDVIVKKGPLLDAEVIRLRSHVRDLSKELTGAITKKDDLKVDLLHEEIQASVKKLTTGGTASGRSVYAYKLMAQDSFDPAFWMRRAQKAFGIDDLPKNVTERINGFITKKDATSLAQYVANLEQSSWINKLATLRTAGLLTGIPKTDLRNIGSNIVLKNLEDIADLSTTKGWDALAGLFTGKRTTRVTFGDILQSWGKFNEGARAGLELLRTGKDLSKFTGEKIVYKKAFNKFSDNPIERGLSRYTDLIFQRLEAEDKPFKAMAYAKFLLEKARIEGMEQGLRGKDLEKFMDDFIAKPSKEMTEQAIQYARYLTLQTDNWMNDLWKAAGRFSKQLEAKALTGEFKNRVSKRMAIELYSLPSFLMQMISPFNRVATNLFLRPLEFSPAGFLNAISKGIKGDQAGFAKSAGRATLGTMILGGLYTLFTKEGAKFESAELDENKKINQLKRRVGKSIYDSITFKGIDGKEWNIEFGGLDPLPKLFLMTGFAQKVEQGKMTTGEALEHLASSMLDQTYTTGLQDILGLSVFGGYRDLNNYIGRQGASFVPTMVYNFAKILDEEWKLNDGIIENTMNKIPILKGNLPPRFDALGRPATMDKNPFLRAFNEAISPIKIKQVEYNPIDRELERLYNRGLEDVLPSEPQKYIKTGDTKIDFTSKELSRIQKERGRNVWKELGTLFKSPEYRMVDDTEKSDLIQSKYREVMKSVKEKTILNIVRSRDIDHTDKLNFILQVDTELGQQYFNRYRSRIDLGKLSKTARKKIY